MLKVTAIFDIGKTNKKILLFDKQFELVYEHEEVFEEVEDDDGFPCDDLDRIEKWIRETIETLIQSEEYDLQAVNFTTYGASVVYLNAEGKRIAPLYNYLKTMPDDIPERIYSRYGGREEFCRKTASPASGMLNSGLQIVWLKHTKPETFRKVKHVLNFPQYLSYLFTGKIVSDYTYVGCHTAMWDFDQMQYHPWLSGEGIFLPETLPGSTTFPVTIKGKTIQVGVGAHDSSASLVPYLKDSKEPFILCSTGTWIIFMNPFNNEPLTIDQLQHDCLCYLSTDKTQVKSSLQFLGHVHDVNAGRIASHFSVEADFYKTVKPNTEILKQQKPQSGSKRVFFKQGIPEKYIDESVQLTGFPDSSAAYHQLMSDLTSVAFEALQKVTSKNDTTTTLYISGGFNRNELFTTLLAQWLPDKKIIPSEVKNATALGAAMVISSSW